MRLIIAEKPSLGREIAGVLGFEKKESNSIITKSGDRVTWAFGHLLIQAEPDHYLPADLPKSKSGAKQWRLEDLPILPDQFVMTTKDKEIYAHVMQIGKWLNECDSVIHAGDPDREGQIIVDEVLEILGNKKPVQRIWLQDLTHKGISKALHNMKDNAQYKPLYQAALGRQRADWLVGMNLTRAMTLINTNRNMLSVGRVQSSVLRLIVDRDLAIENFVSKDFFELYANTVNGINAKYTMPDAMLDAQGYCINKALLEAVKSSVEGKTLTVDSVETKREKRNAPLPFSLSALQKEANKKLGLSASRTLEVAQSLYEQKLTSYPRTDCQYLSENQHAQADEILNSLKGEYMQQVMGATPSLKSSAYNDKKVTAHTAIIPTGKDASGLTGDEKAVFDMIARVFIAQFYPARETDVTEIKLSADEHKFTAKGKTVVHAGWSMVFGSDEEADKSLPVVKEGDALDVQSLEIQSKKTTPPARFNEGTLIDAMVSVAKYVDDPEQKAMLKEVDGIGTEATRGNILETLKKREYIEVKGKQIISTAKGRDLISILPEELKSPVLTAKWESDLTAIANQEASLIDFESRIRDFVKSQIAHVKTMSVSIGQSKEQQAEQESLGTCPKCGKGHIIQGKKGYGCSAWKGGCDFVIWQEIAGKKISKTLAKQIIKDGQTKELVEGLTSKAGKIFSARLRLDDDKKVVFAFDQKMAGNKNAG